MTSFLLALAYRSWVSSSDDEVQDDVEDKRVAQMMADEEGHFRPAEPDDDEPWDEWDDDLAPDKPAPAEETAP